MSEFLVRLQLGLVREFTTFAELALLTGSAVIRTFVVVVALVQGVIVA